MPVRGGRQLPHADGTWKRLWGHVFLSPWTLWLRREGVGLAQGRQRQRAPMKRVAGGWWSTLCSGCDETVLLRHMDELWQERSPAQPNHHPTFSHSSPVRALLCVIAA